MRKILILLFVAMLPMVTYGQNYGQLSLDVDAEGFFFDAEYGTPFAKGYTVTGFRLSPTLVYSMNKKAQLRVGFNATLFAGMDSLYKLRPTISLIYKPTDWLGFVAGTLIDNNHHQLAAPVIDPARHIFNYQEDGIQILTNTDYWKSDTWLDWTHYLVPWTPDQELFTMGSKHDLMLLHLGETRFLNDPEDTLPSFFSHLRHFYFIIPVHFIASHRGGEMKTIDTNTVTTFNEKTGARLEYYFSKRENVVNSLFFDLPFYFYHLEDNDLDHGGRALYPTLKYCWSQSGSTGQKIIISTLLGFWHGDHYFSAYGSPLFWSANTYSRQHMPPSNSYMDADIRDIVTCSISLEHQFKGVSLGLTVDALHDLNLKNNDFVFSFFLRYNGSFALGKH